mmetsp:Transcript_1874/g.6149  ORF Transcript_1874/g.6149 Transcript_1874/m.6149 type:complete len:255 (+) Transcript_1874:2230-2994(+)
MSVSATGALPDSSARSNTCASPFLSCSLDSSNCVRMMVGSPHETASLTASMVVSTSESSEVRMRMSRSLPADTSSEVEKKESCGMRSAPLGCLPSSHTSSSRSMYISGVHGVGSCRSNDASSVSSVLDPGVFLRRISVLSHQSRKCLAAPPESTKTTTGRACFSVGMIVSSVLGPPPTTRSTIGGKGSFVPSSSRPKELEQMHVSNAARRSISEPKASPPSLPLSTSTKCEWFGSSATRCLSKGVSLSRIVLPL